MVTQTGAMPTTTAPAASKASTGCRLNGLLVAQFFGAFNDNALKMLLALLAIKVIPSGYRGLRIQEAVADHDGVRRLPRCR